MTIRSLLLLSIAVLAAISAGVRDAEARGARTFAYAHDPSAQNQLFAFQVAKDGTLTEVAGSPFVSRNGNSGCSALCQSMAYSRKRKMLVTAGGAGVSVWRVGKDGVPTEVDGSPFGGAVRAISVAVAERGKRVFVYAADINNDEILGFTLEKDGTLTALDGFPISSGLGPLGMTVGKTRLFVSNTDDQTFSVYAIAKNGALTEAPGSPFASGLDSLYNLQSDAKGRFVYIGSETEPEIASFAVDKKTAVAAPIGPLPISVEFEPNDGLAVHKRGFAFAFTVSGDGTNDTRAFTVGKNGGLAPLGDVQSTGMDSVAAHALDASGKLLVIASAGGDAIATLAVDRKTGALTPLDSQPIDGGADPVDADDVNAVVIVRR